MDGENPKDSSLEVLVDNDGLQDGSQRKEARCGGFLVGTKAILPLYVLIAMFTACSFVNSTIFSK